MGKELPGGQVRVLEAGWAHRAGQEPDLEELQLGLCPGWFARANLPGMPEQREAGAGKISCFLQGRTDPLGLLTGHLIPGLFREKTQCLCSANRQIKLEISAWPGI